MADIRFVPLSPEEYAPWRTQLAHDYGAEHARVGTWTAEEALAKAEAEILELIPDGTATPGHYFYAVEDATSGAHVGLVWFRADRGPAARKPEEVFVFELLVYEPFRGHGYGEATMRQVEVEARGLGFPSVSLHVFGHNRKARALYEKLGYEPTNIRMTKRLTPAPDGAGGSAAGPAQ